MIYFDNAATSLQKPESVFRAVSETMAQCASPGRGSYAASARAADVLYRCREEAAELFEVSNAEQIVFTSGTTQGLNIAIRNLVYPGDSVVISAWEHNAVTRTLADIDRVDIRVAKAPLFDDEATVDAFRNAIAGKPAAVICTHVSNVFGYILPLTRIADLCREHHVPLVVDAAQSAGCLPVSWQRLSPAFLAMPGHKGLYGPQGTGILICAEGQNIRPLLTGGTGSASIDQAMPAYLPDRLEAGTQNVGGIGGLCEGIRFVKRLGISRIQSHESDLCVRMWKGLEGLGTLRCYHALNPARQSGVLSFTADGQDCEDLGGVLGENGFALRAGLHCAPQAHRSAGTLESGTLRASFSVFNSGRDVDRLIAFLARKNDEQCVKV